MKTSQWRTYVVVGVVVTIVAVLAPPSASWLGIGHSGATQPAPRNASPDRTATSDSAGQQPFDYFPDHYVNQAKAPAEPIEPF
jgi:hypothetical protein